MELGTHLWGSFATKSCNNTRFALLYIEYKATFGEDLLNFNENVLNGLWEVKDLACGNGNRDNHIIRPNHALNMNVRPTKNLLECLLLRNNGINVICHISHKYGEEDQWIQQLASASGWHHPSPITCIGIRVGSGAKFPAYFSELTNHGEK